MNKDIQDLANELDSKFSKDELINELEKMIEKLSGETDSE